MCIFLTRLIICEFKKSILFSLFLSVWKFHVASIDSPTFECGIDPIRTSQYRFWYSIRNDPIRRFAIQTSRIDLRSFVLESVLDWCLWCECFLVAELLPLRQLFNIYNRRISRIAAMTACHDLRRVSYLWDRGDRAARPKPRPFYKK